VISHDLIICSQRSASATDSSEELCLLEMQCGGVMWNGGLSTSSLTVCMLHASASAFRLNGSPTWSVLVLFWQQCLLCTMVDVAVPSMCCVVGIYGWRSGRRPFLLVYLAGASH